MTCKIFNLCKLSIKFVQEIKRTNDKVFRFIPIAVALSFGFYLPVVLFSGIVPIVGILMIPKTLAYVWVIWMGWQLYKQSLKSTIFCTCINPRIKKASPVIFNPV